MKVRKLMLSMIKLDFQKVYKQMLMPVDNVTAYDIGASLTPLRYHFSGHSSFNCEA